MVGCVAWRVGKDAGPGPVSYTHLTGDAGEAGRLGVLLRPRKSATALGKAGRCRSSSATCRGVESVRRGFRPLSTRPGAESLRSGRRSAPRAAEGRRVEDCRDGSSEGRHFRCRRPLSAGRRTFWTKFDTHRFTALSVPNSFVPQSQGTGCARKGVSRLGTDSRTLLTGLACECIPRRA